MATRLRVRLVSVDAEINRGGVCGPRVMAPPFLLATQSCPVATLRTTPATRVWSISAASETAYWGWLYRKLTVPSMGSTIQVTPVVAVVAVPSSPIMPSPGRSSVSMVRMTSSAAVSTMVTGSTSEDLVVVTAWRFSMAARRSAMTLAAAAAMVTAVRASSA